MSDGTIIEVRVPKCVIDGYYEPEYRSNQETRINVYGWQINCLDELRDYLENLYELKDYFSSVLEDHSKEFTKDGCQKECDQLWLRWDEQV